MFYHPSDFTHYFSEAESGLIAKLANAKIDKRGQVCWGNVYEDGTYMGFTTEKADHSTHVAIVVGASMMASLAPQGSPIKIDDLSEEDEAHAMQAQMQRLRQKHKSLIEKDDELGKARR